MEQRPSADEGRRRQRRASLPQRGAPFRRQRQKKVRWRRTALPGAAAAAAAVAVVRRSPRLAAAATAATAAASPCSWPFPSFPCCSVSFPWKAVSSWTWCCPPGETTAWGVQGLPPPTCTLGRASAPGKMIVGGGCAEANEKRTVVSPGQIMQPQDVRSIKSRFCLRCTAAVRVFSSKI
ncbi:unnamed protein product [Scytosiphon promiscuus]